ncbi:16S rRNA (guanine(966)-N(2))-methyltransferase RsmD [Terasakiispira papahanaumokuakeensis]|nr:16S rRNA (guanine(966)-N(2))-methyltransferase RsmD [Terasakiispira papahanaumokuakeensis]
MASRAPQKARVPHKMREAQKSHKQPQSAARNRSATSATGQIRIIGGQWRGRKLTVPSGDGLRPTTDRMRETLFNWLQFEVPYSRCLDLFAGTGALGFEALSRQASAVYWSELSPQVSRHLNTLLQQLAPEHPSAKVIQTDALTWLQQGPEAIGGPVNIAFVDPPFHQNLLSESCQALEQQGWLAPNAWIYIEHEQDLKDVQLPSNWLIYREKKSGQVSAKLLQRQAS